MSESAEYFGVRPNAPVKVGQFQMFESNIFTPCGPSAPQAFQMDFGSPDEPALDAAKEPRTLNLFEESEMEEPEPDPEREEIERRKKEAERVLAEARRTAESLLADARRRADETDETCRKLLEEARRQTEQIEAGAYQAGFEQGEEAGKRLGEQKVDLILKSLRSVIEAAVSQRDALMKTAEQDLVKTAFLLALQMIHREIRQDPSVVLDMVRAALSKFRKASRVTVQVSPQDFQYLEEHIESLRSLQSGDVQVQLEPSDEVGRGGCRIRSDVGEVDARIETVLEAFRKQVWEIED